MGLIATTEPESVPVRGGGWVPNATKDVLRGPMERCVRRGAGVPRRPSATQPPGPVFVPPAEGDRIAINVSLLNQNSIE